MDRLKDPPTWLKVTPTQEIDLQPWAPRQWTSTTTRRRCGLILLPSLTLRDHLVKAALKSNTPKTTPYPIQSCQKQDCQTCKLIKRRDKLPQNNREYKLAKDVNCQTNNVIYLLECTCCKTQYVGETKRNFLTRFKEHLADIRHNRDTPISKHFNLNSHKMAATPAQLIPTILSRIVGHPDRTMDVRKNKEKMWIHTLRSTAPHSIKVRE